VAFPTETVYGLGADAENPQAIAAIYAAKGRPSNHPVIVHVPPNADIEYWAASIPQHAHTLIDAFWPGPLTLILPRAARIPSAVSGGQDSIGLRCPSHPVAHALLQTFKGGKGGVAAPSANKFGHVSPTTAQHVRDEFGTELPCILDGGQSEVGIESTIIDLSRKNVTLLRPGQIGAERIAARLGIWPQSPDSFAPRVSGSLDSHYAPLTPVGLVQPDKVQANLNALTASGRHVALIQHSSTTYEGYIAHCSLPFAADGYAHDLYVALRSMDTVRADIILIEAPPDISSWQAVNDRLRRAGHGTDTMFALL